MDGTRAVLAGVGAHQEPGGGNLDQGWFERRGRSFGLGWSDRHGGCRRFSTGVKFTSAGLGRMRCRRRSCGFGRRSKEKRRALWLRSLRRGAWSGGLERGGGG